MTKFSREYKQMISEMLASYGINALDSKVMNKRVLVVEKGVSEYWFVDGVYAFTVTMFVKENDDWGPMSRYHYGKSYKIKFDEKLIGYRIKEVE